MEVLDQLSVALGFATLAGINLYLTAFVTGVAIRFHWIVLAERYHELSVLGEPVVLAVTGILLVMEFFADKIPWVDSLWDAIHTLVRPVGGGLMAMSAVGTTRPELDVIAALLGAGAASVSHGFKAGTRLTVNHSPEPISNSLISVTEDVAVLGGLSLMAVDPKILGIICAVFLGIALYTGPVIFRRLRGFHWLLFHDVLKNGWASESGGPGLSESELKALGQEAKENPRVLACVPGVTGRTRFFPGICSWLVGRLVAIEGSGPGRPRLLFVAKRWRSYRCVEFPSIRLHFARQDGLLGDKLCVYEPGGKFQVLLRTPRGMGHLVQQLIDIFAQDPPLVPERKALSVQA